MAIRLPPPPAGADEILREHGFGGRGMLHTLRNASAESDEATLIQPHRVYAISREAILRGDLLSAAEPIAWRYLLTNGDSAISSAELTENNDGGLTLQEINQGPFVAATADTLIDAEKIQQIKDGDFELRLLRIPSVYFVALWLHGDESDLILPMAPATAGLEVGHPYPPDEVLAAVRPIAESNAAFDADPTG